VVTSESGNTFTLKKASTGDVTRTCTDTNTRGACPSTGWDKAAAVPAA
jgi:hypothetical protein